MEAKDNFPDVAPGGGRIARAVRPGAALFSRVKFSRPPDDTTAATMTTAAQPLIRLTPYQSQAFWKRDQRLFFLSWSRRARKSTTLCYRALDSNLEEPGNLNIVVSCNKAAGAEVLYKQKIAWEDVLKEIAATWSRALEELRALESAKPPSERRKIDSNIDGLNPDDVLEKFDHSKFETKIWHDRTTYSRTKVIAGDPMQAVGWGGNLLFDEITRTRNLKEVLEAVMPFIASNPRMWAIFAGTPPPDDAHYSYELTMPPQDDFAVNPSGTWYTSASGMLCHRVSVDDMAAAGIPQYSLKSGDPITPDQAREESFDRTAWDRNFRLKYIAGGASAFPMVSLRQAMQRGKHTCRGNQVTDHVVAA